MENQKIIERNVLDGLFAKPTEICVDWNTVIVVDSAAKKLKSAVSVWDSLKEQET